MAHYPAFVQHYYLVGTACGTDTLGYQEHGAVLRLLPQPPADLQVRTEVYGGEAVVEYVDLRFLADGPGDGDPLLLASGDVPSFLRQVDVLTFEYLNSKMLTYYKPNRV